MSEYRNYLKNKQKPPGAGYTLSAAMYRIKGEKAMTKKELSQYRGIVAEIRDLEEQIKNNTLHDTVTGSDSEFPFTQHTMSVSGMESTEDNRRDMRRLSWLKRRKKRIDKFVDGIEDIEMQKIIRYRYIKGSRRPSWQWIALKLGAAGDGSTERKKHNRFLKVSRNS